LSRSVRAAAAQPREGVVWEPITHEPAIAVVAFKARRRGDLARANEAVAEDGLDACPILEEILLKKGDDLAQIMHCGLAGVA
jgi:hypothetical protein